MSFGMPSAQASGVFGGISGIVEGIGGILAGSQQKSLGDYNAQIFEQKAAAERQSQQLLEFQKRKVIKSQISSQVAATGSSGFRFSGDPITIMHESLSNAEMDIMIDKYNSEVKARGFQNDANLTKWKAKNDATKSYAGAGLSFLSSAAKLATVLG